MPYIKQEIRDKIDGEIDGLVGAILKNYDTSLEGVVNYSITRVIDKIYGEGGYKAHNAAIGVLECIKLEYYRKQVGVFEDWKCLKNGEVYERRSRDV